MRWLLLFVPTYVVWGSEDWYAPSIADGHFHKISTWEEVHMNHVCSSIGFLTKLAHPSSWIAQHGPLITWIALVASISNQWSMPFPIKMWAITRFICWYETKWCWYETKWHCWSEFGVGSCANEVEDSVSFVSRSPPSIQVMIPCAIAARGENTMFKDWPG